MLRRTRALLRRLTGAGNDRRATPGMQSTSKPCAARSPMRPTCRPGSATYRGLRSQPDRPAFGARRDDDSGQSAGPGRRPTHHGPCLRDQRPRVLRRALVARLRVLARTVRPGDAFARRRKNAVQAKRPRRVRYPTRGTVTYHLLTGANAPQKTAELADLAPAGVGLIVDEPIEAGSAITINLQREHNKSDRPMLACIVYVTDRPDGKWAIGCNFLHELSEKDLNELIWRSGP